MAHVIYVDDLAALAVTHGARTESLVVDAIGPETFTYRQLVETPNPPLYLRGHASAA